MASKAEKAYYNALQAYVRGDFQGALAKFEECVGAAPTTTSALLFAAVCWNQLDRTDWEVHYLERVAQSESPMPDPIQAKYLPPFVTLNMKFHVTDMIEAEAPFDPGGACLALAERYQTAGKLEEAIGLVQQLHEASPTDEAIALSLADLLMADGDHEGVLEVVKGFTNDSDLGAALLHIRGRALAAMGMETGALDMYRDALAKSSRDPELLKAIRYDRAQAYLAAGQKARAKQDFERLFAADAGYLDVRDQLAALAT